MTVIDEILEKKAIIKENNQKIYNKGVVDENLEVTNKITVNNTRINYHNTFQYSDWSGYKFAYPIKPTGYICNMFYSCYEMTELPTPLDFSAIFTYKSDDGKTDYTKDTTTYRKAVFAYCRKLEYIPDLNMRAIGGLEEWFFQCWRLHTIEMLRVNENTIYKNTFNSCTDLQNIAFDGVIGQDIGFKDSPLLTKKSLTNIAEHLQDFSSEEGTDNLRTITFHNTIKTYLRDDPEGQIIGSLIASKRWGVM